MSKIVIIGAGAMGSAFALPCLDNNHDINIVGTHLENEFIENLKKITQRVSKNGARNNENRGMEGVWEILEAILARKLPWRLSWPILDRRGEAKMAARWPNLAPRWSQDGAKMGQVGL